MKYILAFILSMLFIPVAIILGLLIGLVSIPDLVAECYGGVIERCSKSK